MPSEQIPEPWRSFLSEVDRNLKEKVELHCLGGFVVTMLYGLARSTADVDVITIAPGSAGKHLLGLAGKGSKLHRKYGMYLDYVTVAAIPEDYDRRLTEMFPGAFEHLSLLAFDPYDIALAKLERNIQRDRDDVKYLARTVPFDRPDSPLRPRRAQRSLRERVETDSGKSGSGRSDFAAMARCD